MNSPTVIIWVHMSLVLQIGVGRGRGGAMIIFGLALSKLFAMQGKLEHVIYQNGGHNCHVCAASHREEAEPAAWSVLLWHVSTEPRLCVALHVAHSFLKASFCCYLAADGREVWMSVSASVDP